MSLILLVLLITKSKVFVVGKLDRYREIEREFVYVSM